MIRSPLFDFKQELLKGCWKIRITNDPHDSTMYDRGIKLRKTVSYLILIKISTAKRLSVTLFICQTPSCLLKVIV